MLAFYAFAAVSTKIVEVRVTDLSFAIGGMYNSVETLPRSTQKYRHYTWR